MVSLTPAWNILTGLVVLGYFLLPALLVMGSRRPAANPWQWVLATLFTGWMGFAIFLAATEARCRPADPGRRND